MNGLSDIYFLDSDIMFLTPFVGQPHGSANNRQEDLHDTTDHKLSNLEQIVQLNDDVYEIVPVDPLGPGCSSYNSIQPPVPYSYVTDGQQVNEGLAVLEILYNHPLDAPEYIDINDLANVRSCHDSPPVIEVPPDEDDDDDDDDVIFVGEYNKADGASGEERVSSKSSAPAPRRNPVRKARRNARDIAKELLYDEEYAILESSSEDEVINVSLSRNVKNQVASAEDKKDCMNSVEKTFHCNTTLENTPAKNDFMSLLDLGFKCLWNERQCCSRDVLGSYKSVEISKSDDSASFKKPSYETTQMLLRRRRLTQRTNLSTEGCVSTPVRGRSNKRLLKDVQRRNFNSHSSNEAGCSTSQDKNLDVFRKPSPKVTKWLLHKRKYNLRNKPVADMETQEKVPAIDLKELVQSTYDDVRQFVKNIRISHEILNKDAENSEINESKSENYHDNENVPSTSGIVTSTNPKSDTEVTTMSDTMLKSLELLENQAVLFQVISNAEEKNVMKYFKHMQ